MNRLLFRSRCGPAGRALQLQTGRPRFDVGLAKHRHIYANGTWCMQNPSWVQCSPSSHTSFTSVGTKLGEPSPSVADQNCDGMSPDHPSG